MELKNKSNRPSHILPVIVLSQFAGTATWFAGNAVLVDLQNAWGLSAGVLGWMTSSIQLGFILGTLAFAYLAISDRFSPRKIFLICSILGGISNLGIYIFQGGLPELMSFRFLTGFFLAGIYPVGMKIASGWYQKGLGKALGYLVGALVIGTAFPHLIKGLGTNLPWGIVIQAVSAIAIFGGLLMYIAVPDGPYLKKGSKFDPAVFSKIFKSRAFRSSALGYFGHMWELYTFWTFVPFILSYYATNNADSNINVSLWSFLIIALGGAGCAIGGVISLKKGSSKVAFLMLLISGLCCLFSPIMFHLPEIIFLGFLLIWGTSVVADSPQFSTLNAKTAPPEFVGSGLTIVNSIGFAITIISIQLLNYLVDVVNPEYIFTILTLGPVFGLYSLRYLLINEKI